MALTSRITLTGPPPTDPEDFLSDSLGVVFPDDVMVQHGDADHGLLYTSPHLPKPLHISLADPQGEDDRRLFGHYLWNASLELAELIEAGTLGVEREFAGGDGDRDAAVSSSVEHADTHSPPSRPRFSPPVSTFIVASLATLELGAGTALPSLMASLLGAASVHVTDYPSAATISNLRAVVAENCVPSRSPLGRAGPASVSGHEWGVLTDSFALEHRAAFDRVFACDCLWMPWQHESLRRSIAWFLKDEESARAWIVAGFHTGRDKMRGFFEPDELRRVGLETESMWEVDCNGVEREWAWDRGREDVNVRKRWLVVAVLRRVRRAER